MATSLTFGNHLKFGSNSCHNAKGRPTYLHWEKEREKEQLKLHANTRIPSFREEPSIEVSHEWELSPRRVVEWGLTMAAVVFPLPFLIEARRRQHSYGEKAIGEMHIPRGRRLLFMRKPCFVCLTICLFSRCFIVLWIMFSIYALLLSLHHVYVLDMHTSLCYCALLVACLDDHLLC